MIRIGGKFINPAAVDLVETRFAGSGSVKVLMRSGDWITLHDVSSAEVAKAIREGLEDKAEPSMTEARREEAIATLPVGFRPSRPAHFTLEGVLLRVDPDGTIHGQGMRRSTP